jgi:hypothetical protein
MERFKVSGEELRRHYVGAKTLQEIFGDIEYELWAQGLVVCRYYLNGMELSEHDEVKFANVSINDIETLEYMATESDHLCYEVIEAWIDAIPELVTEADAMAAVLEKQNLRGNLKRLHTWTDNFDCLMSSLLLIRKQLGDATLSSCVKWSDAELLSQSAFKKSLAALNANRREELVMLLKTELRQSLLLWLECLEGILAGFVGRQAAAQSADGAGTRRRERPPEIH